MEEKYKFIVPAHKEKERIDLFLTREIKDISRSKVTALIEMGNVFVDSKTTKKSHLVSPEETIEVFIPRERPPDIEPENIPLETLFEDDYLIVINKKPGMVVHPACGNFSGTMANALVYHFNNLSEIAGEMKPGIVHRLDKDTSGAIIVAKDNTSHRILSQQFFERKVEKVYWTVLWGRLGQNEGINEKSIGRSRDRKKMIVKENGKLGITYFKLLEGFYLVSLVEVRPKTGRTHQIRSHFAHVGCPVFGDSNYGGRSRKLSHLTTGDRTYVNHLLSLMGRQALHAKSVGFFHPSTNEFLRVEAPMPEDFQSFLSFLRKKAEDIKKES